MLISGQINVNKVDIATYNVPVDMLSNIYKKDVVSKLLLKAEEHIEIELIDNLEQGDCINLHTQVCILNKEEIHEVFNLLERLKNASKTIPTQLIEEIKDILV